MGLISKEVEVLLQGSNIQYYEKLGYKIPRRKDEKGRYLVPKKTKIMIKIKDLPNSSNVYVDVKCDYCDEIKSIRYCDFLRSINNQGKYYCLKCTKKVSNPQKSSKTKLKNGENSFAQYLIDTYGKDALNLYWSNKNIVSPWEINKSSNKVKIFIKCQEKSYHDIYDTTPANFTSGKHRCPYCTNRNGKVHPLDSIGKLLEDEGILYLWSNKNKKSPYEYAPNSNKKVWWKCLEGIHTDYCREISSSSSYNFRCPDCVRERDESFLQEKVRLYLNELNYNLLHEYKCNIIAENPKSNKSHMPYDNEIIELKLIVEVHGKQHYKIGSWHKNLAKRNNTLPEYELHMIQVRDRYKRIYAKLHGYNYLEIPYTADNKKEVWKKLINKKINDIKSVIVS